VTNGEGVAARHLRGSRQRHFARLPCEMHSPKRGSHMQMPVRDWFEQRSFHHQDFSDLASSGEAMRRPAITLILPAREVAGTIGPILDTVARLNERSGLVDQVLVVDADSADGTADIARAHGAEVYSENELLPEYGPAQGKGDAMWRALSVARGDIVMFADADTRDFAEHFVYGTLGPLLAQHREHLARLTSMLIEPAGHSASPDTTPSAAGTVRRTSRREGSARRRARRGRARRCWTGRRRPSRSGGGSSRAVAPRRA